VTWEVRNVFAAEQIAIAGIAAFWDTPSHLSQRFVSLRFASKSGTSPAGSLSEVHSMRTAWIGPSCTTQVSSHRLAALPLCVIWALLVGGVAVQAQAGWFDSTPSSETANPKPGTNLGRKPPAKEPSTWDKVTSGPKKFFGGIVSPSKEPVKSTKPVNPYMAAMKNPAQSEQKSWIQKMFPPKEPDPPRSPAEWMQQTKRPEW
jgi:hypothetical protein